MAYLSATLTVLYYITYPIVYTLGLILSLLLTIAAPLVHLGHYMLHACWYPIHLLGKLETLYIFIGVAVLVGAVTGTSLHYASSLMISIMKLESLPEKPRGRTLAAYRAEKQEKKERQDPMRNLARGPSELARKEIALEGKLEVWSWADQERGRGRNGLIPNTILEEEDSSEGGF